MTSKRAPSRAVVVAAMRDRHGEQLQRLVERHVTRDAAIVDDACAHAWAELVDACDVDLRPPRWSALAWVTRRTMRRAHELVDARVDATRAAQRRARASGRGGEA